MLLRFKFSYAYHRDVYRRHQSQTQSYNLDVTILLSLNFFFCKDGDKKELEEQ
jgi:hypothetical protein